MNDTYHKALLEIQDLLKGEIATASIANKQEADIITHFDHIEVRTIRKIEKVKRIVWDALHRDDGDAA